MILNWLLMLQVVFAMEISLNTNEIITSDVQNLLEWYFEEISTVIVIISDTIQFKLYNFKPIIIYNTDYTEESYVEGTHVERSHVESKHVKGANIETKKSHVERAYVERSNIEEKYVKGGPIEKSHGNGKHEIGAHIVRSHVEGTHVEEAYVEKSYVEGKHVKRIHIERSKVESTQAEEAHVKGAHVKRSHVDRNHVRVHTVRSYVEGTDVEVLNIERPHFEEPHVKRADIVRSHIDRLHVKAPHIERSHVKGTHVEGAHVQIPHVKGNHVKGAHIARSHVKGTHVEGSHVKGTHVEGAHVEIPHVKVNHVKGAHIVRSQVKGTHVVETHGNRSHFEEVHVERSHVVEKHIKGAPIGKSYIDGTHVEGSYVERSNIEEKRDKEAQTKISHIEGTHVEGAYLERSHGEGNQVKGAQIVRSHAEGAHVKTSQVEGKHVKGTHIERSRVEGNHVEGAHVEGSHVEGKHVETSHVEGDHVVRSHIKGNHVKRAHIVRVRVEGTLAERAHIETTNIEGKHVKVTQIERSQVDGKHVEGAHVERSHVERTRIETTNFEGAHIEKSHIEGLLIINNNETDVLRILKLINKCRIIIIFASPVPINTLLAAIDQINFTHTIVLQKTDMFTKVYINNIFKNITSEFNITDYKKMSDFTNDKNYNSYSFKATLFESVPTVIRTNGGFEGIDPMVLITIAEQLNLSLTYHEPYDGMLFGERYANKTATGSLLELATGDSDITGNQMFIKGYNSPELVFTSTVYSDQLCVLVPKARPKAKWATLLAPYAVSTWILWCFTMLLSMTTFVFIGKCVYYIRPHGEKIGACGFIVEVIQINFSAAPLRYNSQFLSVIVFKGILLIVTLLFNTAYQGSLVIIIKNSPRYQPEINTLEALDLSGYRITTTASNLQGLFDSYGSLSSKFMVIKNQSERAEAFLLRKSAADHWQSTGTDFDYHIVKECPQVYLLAYMMHRDSVFYKKFNEVLNNIVAAGFMQKWLYDVLQNTTTIASKNLNEMSDEPKVIKLEDIQSVFYVLLMGFIVGGLIFCLEKYLIL